MLNSPIHDVLIIGAGPAGASAAIRTRQAGLSTLVVEKQTFPRFRIGESLLPAANALLRELGVWEKIEQVGFVEKFGARFLLAEGEVEKRVDFSTGLVPGLEKTYQVDRARFDDLLIEHARELGAEVRMGATVRELRRAARRADGLEIAVDAPGGRRETVRARLVIDSSGRDQFFPSKLKSSLDRCTFPKRIAIYNHFTSAPRPPGPEGGDTVIISIADGWFWLIPLVSDLYSFGLVTTQAAFKAAGLSPADYFQTAVRETPRLRGVLVHAWPTMPYQVTADYSYFRRKLAESRLILAGDAAGFLDPIFSSGVYLALHSAKLAAEIVIRAHRENRAIRPWECSRYTHEIKTHASVFHRLIEAFYDDHSFSVFMCPQPPMNLSPGITSIVAGHAELTWPLWWRFQIFLLVCRLQRRWPLVPPITLAPRSPAAAPAATA